MTIDNFNQIRSLLKFEDNNKDIYYFVAILQRKKDFPEGARVEDHRLIKAYYVSSLEYLDKRKDEMIALSIFFNARVYINLNPCSYRKNVLKAFDELSTMLLNDNCKAFPHLPQTLSGKYCANGDKTWIVDLDTTQTDLIEEVVQTISELRPYGDKIVARIPTVSGVHLITKPFDLKAFYEQHLINVHKNNPTLLYYSRD